MWTHLFSDHGHIATASERAPKITPLGYKHAAHSGFFGLPPPREIPSAITRKSSAATRSRPSDPIFQVVSVPLSYWRGNAEGNAADDEFATSIRHYITDSLKPVCSRSGAARPCPNEERNRAMSVLTNEQAVNSDVDRRYIPFTGQEYLESLNDGREVWIYGERVENIAEHPAFRNSARMIARMYDALHDPARKDILTTPTEWGGFTHRFYRAPETSRSKSPRATRSPSGRRSHGAGWAAPPTTRAASWARSAPTPSSTAASRTTRATGTARRRRRPGTSTTRS